MITVLGAYGRSYDSIISAKEDWESGKDFQIVGGPYINKSDWKKYSCADTVAFQGSTSTWVLEEGVILESYEQKELMRTLLENG